MLELSALALCTALAAFVLLMLAPVKKSRLMGYVWPIDILFSGMLLAASLGTYSGFVLAMMAGLMFSALTRMARWWFGSEVFSFRTWSWEVTS